VPGSRRIALFPVLLLIVATPACWGQRYFATALGGISALSADAANFAAGIHLNDWFSLQADYVWNRNDFAITETSGSASLQQDRKSSQRAAIADLLLYFRSRRSRIRPYLSVGSGFVLLRTSATQPVVGALTPIPPQIDTVKLPLRVAVGIDLLLRGGWGFRYSFSETMTGNPLSATLDPPGSRGLANFQNLFGFVKYF
jgi:hypothetical protein